MDVTPLVREGLQIIQSYSENGFRVSGKNFDSAVIVSPNITQSFGVSQFSELKETDFDSIVDAKNDIDVLLVGTGQSMAFLPANIQAYLNKNEIYPDMMDTGAACRTFNVLVAEGRRVTALLFKNT